jgi:hypothetical protein
MSVAAAFLICCVCVSTGPTRAGEDGAKFLLFSGADLWRDGGFMHGGLLWSPSSLDHEGFTVKLLASGGLYRYRSGASDDIWVIGTEEELQALAGWRFKRDRLEVGVFAGLDIKDDATRPYDPANRLHGLTVGGRAAVNLWFEPTPSTMIAADASVSSIINSYSARAAFGWRLRDWFYLGPEAQAFACIGFTQARLGIHLTGLKSGQFEWSAAAGWSGDGDHRSSPYLRIGMLTRR